MRRRIGYLFLMVSCFKKVLDFEAKVGGAALERHKNGFKTGLDFCVARQNQGRSSAVVVF
jgi:hypothetical protein